MTRRKLTEENLDEREKRAADWKNFMRNNKFTEVRLAELLGISRRTVQMVRAGKVTPHNDTLRRYDTLVTRHSRNKVA